MKRYIVLLMMLLLLVHPLLVQPAKADMWDWLFGIAPLSVTCTETFVDEVNFSGTGYDFRCPLTATRCKYEVSCREDYYPYVGGEFDYDGSGYIDGNTEISIRCRKAAYSTFTGGVIKKYFVTCVSADEPAVPILVPDVKPYYSTTEEVKINVRTTNVPNNAAITGRIGSNYKTAIVSNSIAAFNFGTMAKGRYTFTVSYGSAEASESVNVLSVFKVFDLTTISYNQNLQGGITARLRITDSTGVGLSVLKKEVSLSVTAKYNDGSDAGGIVIEDLGDGNYDIRVAAARSGYVNIKISASKEDYISDERSIAIQATSPNIFIDTSKLPSSAELGKTINIVIMTRTPVEKKLIDADYMTIDITHPAGLPVDHYGLSGLIHESTGTYSLNYKFSELTSGIEMYTVIVVADALQTAGLGRGNNLPGNGISVTPGAGTPVLPPGTEVECKGLRIAGICTGIDTVGIIILLVIVVVATKVVGLW